jgi:hypothetical protein
MLDTPEMPNDGRLQRHAIDTSQALTAPDKVQTHQFKSIGDPGMTKIRALNKGF